ncbi:nitrogen fixation protein [Pseudorhodoferax sp.]|uniref:nitrogen fixation protein n=1 Tax=Pseudorhodoferax sp. TaxID=1993553 RepID=UPI0039E32305
MASDPSVPLCPSAHPDLPGARVFAVVVGSVDQPRADYLEHAVPLTGEIRALAAPVDPAEVFRMASPCVGSACGHFDAGGHVCRLARKTAALAPIVVERLPRCAIRPQCVWWKQEGVSACRRCPQVATLNFKPGEAIRAAADPAVPLAQARA